MTNKEFKRLGRAQLIDIIYEFQLKQEELTAENEKLKEALSDRRLRVRKAGNIAEASLEIFNVMQSAQDAASLYLEEIRTLRNETKEKCQQLLEQAQQEAEAILNAARHGYKAYDSKVEAIIQEFGHNNQATGDQK